MKSPAIGVGKETSDPEKEMHQGRKLSKAGAQRCNSRCKDVITVSVTAYLIHHLSDMFFSKVNPVTMLSDVLKY